MDVVWLFCVLCGELSIISSVDETKMAGLPVRRSGWNSESVIDYMRNRIVPVMKDDRLRGVLRYIRPWALLSVVVGLMIGKFIKAGNGSSSTSVRRGGARLL